MQHPTYDYTRFKQDINLTQYAAYLGYEVDRKKSTRNSIAMRSSNDKVIISKRNSYWVYFSVFNDQDSGTIVDFVKNRSNKTFPEIGQELNTWLGGGAVLPEPKTYVSDVQERQFDPARVKRIFNYCRPATAHPYLESRGITPSLLSSQRFTGRIFTDRHGNAVFPHFKKGQVCGLEMKNAEKGFLVRGSQKTFWRSNTKQGDDTLVISEAVIDALSYHRLFSNQQSIYMATGGGISADQADILKAFVKQTSYLKNIILITDNDQGGDKLAERLEKTINSSGFKGQLTRHHPKQPGQDWNDVLQARDRKCNVKQAFAQSTLATVKKFIALDLRLAFSSAA